NLGGERGHGSSRGPAHVRRPGVRGLAVPALPSQLQAQRPCLRLRPSTVLQLRRGGRRTYRQPHRVPRQEGTPLMASRVTNYVLENTDIAVKLGKRSAGDKGPCVIVDFSGLDIHDRDLAADAFGAVTL